EVRDGAAVRRGIARVNGKEAVVMTVTKQFGADTLTVTDRARKALAELRPFMPAGVSTVTFFDQSELIHVATKTLEEALLVAGLPPTPPPSSSSFSCRSYSSPGSKERSSCRSP